MRIVGIPVLDKFKEGHADIRKQLDAWIAEVQEAQWKNPQDIKSRYRSADFLSGNRVIFNIKGNRYRVLVKIAFTQKIVLIQWVGTHAEYDKTKF